MDNTERNEYLADQYAQGRTLEDLGREVGITRERVRQIITQLGAKSSEGGASKRSEERKAKILDERDQRYLQKYGLPYAEYVQARNDGYQKAWADQKRNAQRRGIGWHLTLKGFIEVWEGQFHLRGRNRDAMVMTRIDLDQPFTKDNVKIVTLAESARQNISRMHEERK